MAKYTKEQVMQMVRENNVRFIRLQFTDILGSLKNVAITDKQLEKALKNDCMFDGSSIEGFVRIDESDTWKLSVLEDQRVLVKQRICNRNVGVTGVVEWITLARIGKSGTGCIEQEIVSWICIRQGDGIFAPRMSRCNLESRMSADGI